MTNSLAGLHTGVPPERRSTLGPRHTVWHLDTGAHDLLLANGAAAESLLETVTPSRFDDGAGAPEGPAVDESPLPRVTSARQLLRPLRRALGLDRHGVAAACASRSA